MQRQSDLPAYLRDVDVAALFGISRITVWRWARDGLLPPPVKLGPHTTRWNSAEIESWVDGKCR